MSKAPAVTLSAIGVTPTSPATDISSGSGEAERDVEVLGAACGGVARGPPSGALTATGSSAMGLRTVWPPPVHVSARPPTSPSGRGARERERDREGLLGAGRERERAGVTTDVEAGHPGRWPCTWRTRTDVLHPAGDRLGAGELADGDRCLVQVRAADAVSVSNGGANWTPRLTMYWRYSFGVVG